MDTRIREFLMMPYMQHIRKLFKHLILLEISIGSSKIRKVSQSFHLKRGRISPFMGSWAKASHPLDISPPFSNRMKISHYDSSFHNLRKWNSVHTLDISSEERPEEETIVKIENALEKCEITDTVTKRTIQYGSFPIGCTMEIMEGYTENNTAVIIVTADTLADFSMTFTNPKYLKDTNPDKRMMATLAQMDFSPTRYRNCLYYLFEFIEKLADIKFDVNYMSSDMKEGYEALLEVLEIGVI